MKTGVHGERNRRRGLRDIIVKVLSGTEGGEERQLEGKNALFKKLKWHEKVHIQR